MSTLVPLSLAFFIASSMTAGSSPSPLHLFPATEQQQSSEHQATSESTPSSAVPSATPPGPDAKGIYHKGSGASAPKLISFVEPEFSEKARKKKLAGTCTVSLVVDQQGLPQDVHIVRSAAEDAPKNLRATAMTLDEQAIKAVSLYRFEPATFQGKPVPYETTVDVNFKIY